LGSGGDTLRTDDNSGVKTPVTKIELGVDGSFDGFLSSTNPMPVSDNSGSLTVDNGGTFVVQENGAALTALQVMDDWDESDRCKSNIVVGQAGVAAGTGTDASNAVRVSLCTDIALPAGDNNIGNVDIVTVPAPLDVTGGGVEASALRVTIASDSTGVISVDDNGAALTVDNAGTFAVQVDAALPAGSNLIGEVNDRPSTDGGLSMHKTISAASTNATSVKASAGQVYSVQVMNINSAARYLKLYDKASSPTVGTDTPVKTLLIPGNTAGAGMVLNWDKGLVFSSGIAFALTTGITDADTGAVSANETTVNIDYK
jgi:hypothetical protein